MLEFQSMSIFLLAFNLACFWCNYFDSVHLCFVFLGCFLSPDLIRVYLSLQFSLVFVTSFLKLSVLLLCGWGFVFLAPALPVLCFLNETSVLNLLF